MGYLIVGYMGKYWQQFEDNLLYVNCFQWLAGDSLAFRMKNLLFYYSCHKSCDFIPLAGEDT